MATSSIGPGFLTQTTVFTQQFAASFGFVILISLILDVFAQLIFGELLLYPVFVDKRLQTRYYLVLVLLLAILIVMGGLAFNIGNVAGAGLGLNAMLGIDPITGAVISAVFAIFIFVVKEAGKAMDKVAQVAGFVMILLMLYVAFTTSPPVGEAIVRTFAPSEISIFAIVTLVGGYSWWIYYFCWGTSTIRCRSKRNRINTRCYEKFGDGNCCNWYHACRFILAVLGVVSQGLAIDPENPPASVFKLAAGEIGYRIFGVIMWAAAITSVVGAAYTSVSFIRSFHPKIEKYHNWVIIIIYY